MRILVVGGSGLVGSHVMSEARIRGHDVLGTFRSFPLQGLRHLDLADEPSIRQCLNDYKPDWVIHAAGWTWVDGCEKDEARAFRENTEQPALLARVCGELGARMVYFSTTYVFDGTAGPYDEMARPAPVNVYARTKLAGEVAVQDALEGRALIPRVICVWGAEAQRKNFVYQVLKAIREGRSLRIPSDQEGNPTWAGDIAAWLIDLMENDANGVWNLVGDETRCLREEWLRSILTGVERYVPDLKVQLSSWRYEVAPTVILGQTALRPLRAGGLNSKIQSHFPRRVRAPREIDVV